MRYGTGVPMTEDTAKFAVGGIRKTFYVRKRKAAPLPAVTHHAGVVRGGLCPQA